MRQKVWTARQERDLSPRGIENLLEPPGDMTVTGDDAVDESIQQPVGRHVDPAPPVGKDVMGRVNHPYSSFFRPANEEKGRQRTASCNPSESAWA